MPTNPSFKGYTRPVRISDALVPASMISSFVRTPIVRRPCGSTLRASLRESEFARSTLAEETARITLRKYRQHLKKKYGNEWTCSGLRCIRALAYVFVAQCHSADHPLESAIRSMNQMEISKEKKNILHTFVNPGRSTKVRSSTCGLYILNEMGSLLTPLF